jgi:hypothetical protein
MTNPRLRHHWNRNSLHNLLDHLRIAHTSYTSLSPDIGWHSLESHNSHGAGFFCYSGLYGVSHCLSLRYLLEIEVNGGTTNLFSIHNIHNNTSLQHACQTSLLGEQVILTGGGAAVRSVGEFGGHSGIVVVDHLTCEGVSFLRPTEDFYVV